jgi:hypothetical protein
VADPSAAGALIRVPSPGIDTLGDALAAWAPATPRTVIQIEDNRTYAEDLAIVAADAELVIQAANMTRPTLLGDVIVTGGGETARLTLNGLLIAGNVQVPGQLAELTIAHSTLVPGRCLDTAGRPQEPGRPALAVDDDNDRLQVTIDHSIVGPLRLPAAVAGLRVLDSIVDSPVARDLPVLISGTLPSPIPLSSATPSLDVTIGDEGPHRVTLGGGSLTLAQARDALQAAIQAAHDSPAFTGARVTSAANRLIVLPGSFGAVTIAPVEGDPTVDELRFAASARPVLALRTLPLQPFPHSPRPRRPWQ